MEWWILAGVVVLAAAGLAIRLRRIRNTRSEKETDSIYPLW